LPRLAARSRRAAGLGLALLLGCPGCAETPVPVPSASPGASGIRLVVLLAVDQLRADRLSPDQPGGLGRLQREGRVFSDAALVHAFSETCPGHATMLSGRNPAALGVPGNRYVDPETLALHYCVDDSAPDAAVIGVSDPAAGGRSPRSLRAGGLGDWLKQQRPGSRVFSVSPKDRAAITMGGTRPDAAYWLRWSAPAPFTTSLYYQPALPEWVAAWTSERLLADVPDRWHYLVESIERARTGARPDDHPAESPLLGRVAPHPLRRAPEPATDPAASLAEVGRQVHASPFLDAITLAFTRDLIVQEQLGEGPGSDLLAVSLSATDIVGHHYGPQSWESIDALARLDALLADFLHFLEERVAPEQLVVVLTSDHGVLALPEWLLELAESACPLPGGRIDPDELLRELESRLDRRFGAEPAPAAPGRPWFVRAGTRLSLNRERTRAQGVRPESVLALAAELIAAHPGIAKVWTAEDVEAGRGHSALADLYANSWDRERGGDLALQVARDCLLSSYASGTSHGSPYGYDRAVPLVFYGAGVAAGRIEGPAAPVDIAPTLASLLGIEAPDSLDGRVLRLR
jgi:predicted AlkP superfamily pyrophosphatase or phosphodiesterase